MYFIFHFLSTKYPDTLFYIYQNYEDVLIKDLRRADVVIFVRSDSYQEKLSIYFDSKWYKKTYNVKHPYHHYLNKGWNNNPCVEFDTSKYLTRYKDVKNICPLIHFEVYGKKEGRII